MADSRSCIEGVVSTRSSQVKLPDAVIRKCETGHWRSEASAVLGGCGGSPDSSIVIDGEVRLDGLGGTPQAVVRAADGGFVIAGSGGNGWAAGTTSTGNLRWKYTEPDLQNSPSPVASGFNGAVSLANGNVLMCGQHHHRALVTILDESGQLVERRDILPPDGNASIFVSSIDQCLSWNDGVALVGGGSNGRQPYFWLVKLDKNGKEEWGRVSDAGAASSAIQGPSGDLITTDTVEYRSEFVRFDHLGNLVGRRRIEGFSLRTMLVRPAGTDTEYARAVRYGQELGDQTMLTLESDVVHVFPRPNVGGATVSVGDAVPISGSQFVAVRDEVTAGEQPRGGMVLSWITFR